MDANKQLPLAKNPEDKALYATLKRIRHKIFVMSGKGGVGKSSVTANLGAALAAAGFECGILDVDIHGPSIPTLLGIGADKLSMVEHGLIQPVEARPRLRALSLDTLLSDRDQAIIWRGPKKAGAIHQMLTETEWGNLDFLLIDSPPGTGDEHLTVLQMVPDALCLVVSTPQEIALADVRKALNFLALKEAPILGLVENMSAFRCPHCGGRIDLFPSNGCVDLAREAHLPFLGVIPFDALAASEADKGITAIELPGANAAKSAFTALAESVKNACAARASGRTE